MSDLRWHRLLVGSWFFAVVQLAATLWMQAFFFGALPGVSNSYASFPPSKALVLTATAPNLYRISAGPNSIAYHSGARTGDTLDAGSLTPAMRFRLFSGYWWPGERVTLPLQASGGTVKAVALTAVRVPGTLDMWIANAGLAWMLLFAGVILWRRPDTAQARVLSLLLILYNVGLGFQTQNWFTPAPLLDCVLAALCGYPYFMSQTLFATYANLFGRPVSPMRKLFSLIAYGYAFIVASFNVVVEICSATTGVSPALHSEFQIAQGLVGLLTLLPVAAALIQARGSEREQLVWTSASLVPLYAFQFISSIPAGQEFDRIQAVAINMTLFIAPLGLTYSVLNRRLLDIGFTINRVAVYSVLSAIVVGCFVLVEFIVSEVLGTGHGANLIAGAALALVLGLSMRYIHKRVDRVLDEVFFRKRHEDERAIRSFAHEAAFITSQDLLLSRAREVLERRSDASFATIALEDGEGSFGKYDANDPAIVALRAWHKPLDLKTLDTSIAAEFAYPMLARGRLVGLLALGPKRSGENYAPDESEAIAELAHGVGLAIDTLHTATPEKAVLESLRSVAADIGEMKVMLGRALLVAAMLMLLTVSCGSSGGNTQSESRESIQRIVDSFVPALMAKDHIRGMAVGVTIAGNAYVFNYGVASVDPRTPVTGDTLFELGSVSKTFTATLASWAQIQHRLSLGDTVGQYVPDLRGSPFGNVTLLSLGTHTPGGLPLQFPADVTNQAQLMRYFEQWRPAYRTGTYRTYANPGIAMLGFITAKSMRSDFRSLEEQRLLPALGLQHTYIDIPAEALPDYAWGYTDEGKPIRLTPGILWEEAYGLKSTASDMIHYVEDSIDPSGLSAPIQEALVQTHTGYFRAGPMTQDLIWEQYSYPVTLTSLLAGNSQRMLLDPNPVTAIVPPDAPSQNVWLNKTGSTNGFGTYVAFVPSKRIGIVLLANKNYPITDRVTAAFNILTPFMH